MFLSKRPFVHLALRYKAVCLGGALVLAIAGITTWQQSQAQSIQAPAIAQIGFSDVETNVTALGNLQPKKYVDVGAQVSGQILRLSVQPGDIVTKDELLVEIDPSVLTAAVDAGRASLKALNARRVEQSAQHRLAAQRLARLRMLTHDGATSLDDLQSAEATLTSTAAQIEQLQAEIAQTSATLKADEARLSYTKIYAPMAGTVISVDAREGQTLNATYQTPDILRIADLTTMTVWTEVSEADIDKIKPGMHAQFTTLSEDQRQWHGTVRQLLPAPPASLGISVSKGTTPANSKVVVYTVLFDVDNADAALMPQMTAQVVFTRQLAKNTLAVPVSALSLAGSGQDQFIARVQKADGSIEVRQVRIGVRNREMAQVLEGLTSGETVLQNEVTVAGPNG
ncbi:efflux RND transporter periplasmic adaptor subunit [Pseudomonas mosselii]|uniref:efflux RND transporter periplasmic adaptor subunit n=1 Tax=Pseudomonas mosselii TaxID=78327 RepID=UPI000D9AB627|nr:efflux RND transporter periplasmic adaptor subunit [Pseudomonas mosselii]PYC19668.1 efflux RND transporter periplasmic adaptor subunit [Pseudomonas mosselii]